MRIISCSMRTVIILTCLLAMAPASVEAGGVPWRQNYGRAVREARRRGRPLFLQVSSPGCVWCRRLETSTLQDPEVCRMLAERFVPLKLDATEEVQIARELGVRSYPTLFLAGPDGTILDTREGFVGAEEFLERLRRALEAVDNDAGEENSKN